MRELSVDLCIYIYILARCNTIVSAVQGTCGGGIFINFQSDKSNLEYQTFTSLLIDLFDFRILILILIYLVW